MTDDRIRELYVYCVEAYNAGREEIGLTIFPRQADRCNLFQMIYTSRYKDDVALWGRSQKMLRSF